MAQSVNEIYLKKSCKKWLISGRSFSPSGSFQMASRCLPFLHTCVRELGILEISAPTGAVWCWLFLACMEVLQVCDKFNQADQVEEYSLHTASLWEYASQKLRNLGELCGLMPQGAPTSEQLHIVVSLSAGMGDNPGPLNRPSPTDRLKEALCSQDVFIKTYLVSMYFNRFSFFFYKPRVKSTR